MKDYCKLTKAEMLVLALVLLLALVLAVKAYSTVLRPGYDTEWTQSAEIEAERGE